MTGARLMTREERTKWRIRDDQCDVVLSVRLPDDAACLMPMPCDDHKPLREEHYTVDGERHRLSVMFGGRSRMHVIHDSNFTASAWPGRWTRRGVDRRSLCGSLTYCLVGVDAADWASEMRPVDDISRVDCVRCRERYGRLFPTEVPQ